MISLEPSLLLDVEAEGRSDLPAPFTTAFGQLAASLDHESDLTLLGRRLVQNQLLRIVRQQRALNAVEVSTWSSEPRTVVVVGLPRTGTTLLHHLLAHRSAADFVSLWEGLEPFGATDLDRDDRRSRADHYLRFVDRLSPELLRLHPMAAEAPEECDVALQITGISEWFTIAHRLPSYAQWIDFQSRNEYYAAYRRLLAAIRPNACSIVLKSPSHLAALGEVLATFPNSRVVWLHRPLAEVLPSFVGLVRAARAVTSGSGSQESIRKEWLPRLRSRLEAGARWLDDPRVLNVCYDEVVHDLSDTLTRITDFVGLRTKPDAPTAGAIAERLGRARGGLPRARSGADRPDVPELDPWLL